MRHRPSESQQEPTGSATVNFMRNFRALSKGVEFHPCASAQGRDSKEYEGVRGRRRKGRETVSRARALRSFLSSDIGILFRRLALLQHLANRNVVELLQLRPGPPLPAIDEVVAGTRRLVALAGRPCTPQRDLTRERKRACRRSGRSVASWQRTSETGIESHIANGLSSRK